MPSDFPLGSMPPIISASGNVNVNMSSAFGGKEFTNEKCPECGLSHPKLQPGEKCGARTISIKTVPPSNQVILPPFASNTASQLCPQCGLNHPAVPPGEVCPVLAAQNTPQPPVMHQKINIPQQPQQSNIMGNINSGVDLSKFLGTVEKLVANALNKGYIKNHDVFLTEIENNISEYIDRIPKDDTKKFLAMVLVRIKRMVEAYE
jgi:hypothetical protein